MSIKTRLRRAVYETEKMLQRVRFGSLPSPKNDWPILLGISFPKSGTHLLDQILLGFSNVAPFSKRLIKGMFDPAFASLIYLVLFLVVPRLLTRRIW